MKSYVFIWLLTAFGIGIAYAQTNRSVFDYIKDPSTIPKGFKLIPKDPEQDLGALLLIEHSGIFFAYSSNEKIQLGEQDKIVKKLRPLILPRHKSILIKFSPTGESYNKKIILDLTKLCRTAKIRLYVSARDVIYKEIPTSDL